MSSPRVLLTGGAGFIGSHTAVALLEAGYSVVVVDDFSNSSPIVLERVRELADGQLSFHELDLRDTEALDAVLTAEPVEAVVHFAGLKAVGESVAEPLRYFQVNLGSTLSLLDAMTRHEIRRLVFSSSCTVYGDPDQVPVTETASLRTTNPYGRTKLMIEDMLRDVAESDPSWTITLLRYFNPIGAHPSGRIGEDPAGIPNNLMPFAMQVASGRRDGFVVFGDDYPTPDGTCIRDYIHVMDLAEGHLAALRALPKLDGCVPINLGTGTGSSVLEVVRAAGEAVGTPIKYRVGPRRDGDAAVTYGDPSFASEVLGWRTSRTMAEACVDAWRWQASNPDGFRRRELTTSPPGHDVQAGGRAWETAGVPADDPVLAAVTARLVAAGCVAAAEEAAELVAAAPDPSTLEAWIRRREQGEPPSWIIRTTTFRGRTLHMAPGVYVPRFQSEDLAARAAGLLPDRGLAVDLCTGSGAVAAHLRAQVPTAAIIGVDIDPVAAACARRNGVPAVAGDLEAPLRLGASADVVTAVAPYVPTGELRLLPADVQRYEPRRALDGGGDGLELVRRVVVAAGNLLRPAGWLLIEVGADQDVVLAPALAACGFDRVEPWWDDDGDLRGIAARLSPT